MPAAYFQFMRIIPPARPKRDNAVLDAILEHYNLDLARANIIFIRSYYLDTMGEPGKGDVNIYDDAVFLITPIVRESFNANTEPSFPQKGHAVLNLGKYIFYRGLHKGRYPALRPFPEGVKLGCVRNGKPSTCANTNIHRGGSKDSFDVVWSEGCLTIPDIQYEEWRARVWSEMDRLKQKMIDVVIVENRPTQHGQQIFDESGKII